ncbi:hypothetical protein PoB_004605600, partial [Plakobranchus ocellatus]
EKISVSELKSQGKSESSRPYMFAVDGVRKPYNFINKFGTLIGFDVEVVKQVCQIAGKKCATILLPFSDCSFTYKGIDYAGRGIASELIDGCPSYDITIDRKNEFDFTLPYIETRAIFSVAPGNPTDFDPDKSDFRDFKLVRLSGSSTNGPCLTRLDKQYSKFLIADNYEQAKQMILDGVADVLFSGAKPKSQGLETLPGAVHCDDSGAGVLLRKGSHIARWWDPAFKKFYFSGEYNKLCWEAERKYGERLSCLPRPEEANFRLLTQLTASAQEDEYLWRFVVSGAIAPYSFLTKEGKLVGWTKDFISEVCRIAKKKCVLMLAKVAECTARDGEIFYPGPGLQQGNFDACTGYFNTYERQNSFDFTDPYLVSDASFYVLPGNPKKFDPSKGDYSKFVLVRADTSITNDHCLNRLGKKFGKLITVKDMRAAIKTIKEGEADAWFTKRKGVTELEELKERFHCENVGTSVMTRKGSDLPTWWNRAFRIFYASGDFNRFCERKGREFDFDFPCVPPPKGWQE